MRLTKEKAEQNRQLIVETASRMFRLHGMENVSVADIMKESGFTHGGFYNHFKSKDELATEAINSAFVLSVLRYRKGLHPEKIHKNRFHRSSRDTLVLHIATPIPEAAQHQPCPSMPLEMERRFKLLSAKVLNPTLISSLLK